MTRGAMSAESEGTMAVNLGEMILENPALVGEMARSLGLEPQAARSGMEALLPGLARGLQRNASQPGGLDALLGALKNGSHSRYVDDPRALEDAAARSDGNGILGHILGRKDVSRNVASHAAEQSGLGSDLLKQMLPLLATMVMGTLSKQTAGGTSAEGLATSGMSPPQRGGTGLDLLTGFLDADRDGSALDDVLNLAKKFL